MQGPRQGVCNCNNRMQEPAGTGNKRTKTRLVIEESTIYEIDMECEACRERSCMEGRER